MAMDSGFSEPYRSGVREDAALEDRRDVDDRSDEAELDQVGAAHKSSPSPWVGIVEHVGPFRQECIRWGAGVLRS